jgi:SAM-dependent methyltransferase
MTTLSSDPYLRQAQYYDAIYAAQSKDYPAEVRKIRDLITANTQTAGKALLDVGCGTGGHIAYLREWYHCEGLDIDAHMLGVAQQRLPGIAFHQGDMAAFNLGKQFDAVICLFGAVGYTQTVERMRAAIACMAAHLAPGGVLIVEPWFTPDKWNTGTTHVTLVEQPEFKLVRMAASSRRDDVAVIDFHFLVGTAQGVEHFTELHELGLYTREQYIAAFERAGLAVHVDDEGVNRRGLYVGVKGEL